MKLIKLLCFLLFICTCLGCSSTGQVEKQEERKEEVLSDEKIDTKLTLKEEETGVTFIYGKENSVEGESAYYEINQLPFPTFWGGEAYSVITPEGDLYLIDGGFQGEDYERISSYIEEHGGKVKGWILTHPHIDHIGAFLDFMKENSHKVEKVYYSPFTKEFFEEEEDPHIYAVLNNPNAILFYEFLEIMELTKEETQYQPMVVGDQLSLGELTLECFHSFEPNIHDVNGNSLVFTITYKDFCLSLTGDMTEETLQYIEEKLTEESSFLSPDILQIPHHGYMAGIASDALYQLTKPEYVLLDCTHYEYINNNVNIQEHVKLIEDLGIQVIKRFEAPEGNKIIIYTQSDSKETEGE